MTREAKAGDHPLTIVDLRGQFKAGSMTPPFAGGTFGPRATGGTPVQTQILPADFRLDILRLSVRCRQVVHRPRMQRRPAKYPRSPQPLHGNQSRPKACAKRNSSSAKDRKRRA